LRSHDKFIDRALQYFRILIANTRPSGGCGCTFGGKITVFTVLLWRTVRRKAAHGFDFSSRADRLPRDKSGKELRFDERPSSYATLSLSETSISPGPAIHEARTIPGATKITRSSRFRMMRFGLAATAISRRNPSLRSAVTLRVPLCEQLTRCHKGYRGVTPWLKSLSCEVHLPAKPVGGACYIRSFYSRIFNIDMRAPAICIFCQMQLSWNSLNHRILKAQNYSAHIELNFPGFQYFF